MVTSEINKQLGGVVRFLTNNYGLETNKESTHHFVASYLTKLCSANKRAEHLLGHNAESRAVVWQWLELWHDSTAGGAVQFAKRLNQHLKSCVYIAGFYVTVADIVAYFALHSFICELSQHERQTLYPNVSRWFENVQEIEGISAGLKKCVLVPNHLYST